MNTLLIGATSYIGKNFVKKSKITNFEKTSTKKINNYIRFDLTKDKIENIFQKKTIENVVIFSAISNPDECEKNKKISNLVNVKSTIKIIKYLIKKKKYFIFFSTEYVYDGYKGNYSEKSKIGNNLLYAKQKIKVEEYLKRSNYKKFAIIRIAKTYGDKKNDNTIFTNFLKQSLKKRIIKVAKDQYFSALYVDDLVKILDIFINQKITGLFNISGDEKISRLEYLKKLKKKFNLEIEIIPTKFQFLSLNRNIPLNVTMNNNKIKNKIKFRFTKFNQYLNIIFKKYASKYK